MPKIQEIGGNDAGGTALDVLMGAGANGVMTIYPSSATATNRGDPANVTVFR